MSLIWVQCTIIFAIAWGMGGLLNAEGRRTFDAFFRRILNGEIKAHPKPKNFKLTKAQIFPERSNVFEWFFDKKNNGTWVNWVDTVDKLQIIPADAKPSKLIIQTNESICQQFFLEKCLQLEIPILLIGPTGTGKSAVVLDQLVHLPKDEYLANVINFSARTSSVMVTILIVLVIC